ncbi:thiol-disulfide oxidoreductase [Fuerstiella marisgermanici]|uniref:Thiol-disulfide oxidoreductase n=1 Tax=Fuerstiella marisgermanici TaxID=1891926 RepID=A0A1P8WS99_9PLAN|nr:thiol-disulfide oxidoreductase [Fuerstiella marisgermanici]
MHKAARQLHRHLVNLAIVLTASVFAANANADQTISDFTLSSHRGVDWSLDSVADSKLVVVAFLGTECPLARLYGPRLSELQNRYQAKDVAFVGIDANTQDSMTEISAYVARHKITFPMLKDVGNRVADQFKAERTPEVFLLDQNRTVRYRGRVDDQYLVGRSRDKVRRKDLAIAIDELLAGKDVSVAATEAIGCHIGRVRKTEPHGDVTWSNQIVRIFNKSCVECHRSGEIAPFQLEKYDDVIGWEDTILEVIADNRMPPWFANPKHGTFSNDARLSPEEKQLIRTWVKNGMPQGNAADLPEPPKFVKGWRMPKADQVIKVREEAFEIPADGIVDYQYFTVDPGWKEDKFVTAVEARPDNVAVVHHIIAYIVPAGSEDRKTQDRRMLVGYAPGSTPQVLDNGTAIHIPAGSKLVFEMHYTPNGTKQKDLSYIGVKFTDKSNVKKLLRGAAVLNTKFEIPAGAANHKVEADFRLKSDQMLIEMSPHMHLRGKSFRYEAFYPDGTHEILLDVPNYDFNWQLTYELAEPKRLPKGTRIHCTAIFDNSKHNLVNPDPGSSVTWGDQSSEEMMIGFLSGVDADPITTETAVSGD